MSVAALHTRAASNDADSLLYAFIGNDEVVQGPLEATAFAQSADNGIGGPRLAAVEQSAGAIELAYEEDDALSFEDPEVEFTPGFDGSSVIAPLNPSGEVPPATNQPNPAAPANRPFLYTVKPGDTLSTIAARFGITAATISDTNGLNGHTIAPGDNLVILPVAGIYRAIRPGDTLSELAERYGVTINDILAANAMTAESRLVIGKKIIIPGAAIAEKSQQTSDSRRVAIRDTADDQPVETKKPKAIAAIGKGFLRPTSGHVSQHYGRRHTGVDIANRARPTIHAAKDGTVVFAGWNGGYGRLAILDHGGGVQTYYAHTETLYVKVGDKVKQGEAIAKMGSSGRSTGPHLHWEVRYNGEPTNPEGYL